LVKHFEFEKHRLFEYENRQLTPSYWFFSKTVLLFPGVSSLCLSVLVFLPQKQLSYKYRLTFFHLDLFRIGFSPSKPAFIVLKISLKRMLNVVFFQERIASTSVNFVHFVVKLNTVNSGSIKNHNRKRRLLLALKLLLKRSIAATSLQPNQMNLLQRSAPIQDLSGWCFSNLLQVEYPTNY
jgi:hypothetical protein